MNALNLEGAVIDLICNLCPRRSVVSLCLNRGKREWWLLGITPVGAKLVRAGYFLSLGYGFLFDAVSLNNFPES